MTQAQETTPTARSIVKADYRNKYKDPANRDWLAKLLDAEVTKTKTVKVSEKSPDGESTITKDVQRPDGVDVEKLYKIADNNGINYDSLKGHEEDHGFPGRARMTIGNGLRRVAKQRHGVYNTAGKFVSADAEFLEKVGAADAPTHKKDGTKIAPPKAPKEAPAAAPDA